MRARSIAIVAAVASLAGATGCQMIAGIQDLPGPNASSAGDDGGDNPFSGGPSGNAGNGNGAGSFADGGARPPASPLSDPPSCAGVPKTCGANGTDDCCDSPAVPGGQFYRNYDAKDFTNSNLTATLHPYRLDKYEVTVARFRQFVTAYDNGWRPADNSGRNPNWKNDNGWWSNWNSELPQDAMSLQANVECHSTFQTYTRTPGANENRPINCVTWYVAYAFCAWDSARLPTDSEMNFAQSGGEEQRYFPWNDTLDETRASFFIDDQRQCFGDKVSGCQISDLTLVGSHPAGDAKWGQSDLGGNVAEWTRDGDGQQVSPCTDCIDGPGSDGKRRARGGNFTTDSDTLRSANNFTSDPSNPSERIGVRCARNP
jgi:formylglycine-generating enzyme required for sulfatase activity